MSDRHLRTDVSLKAHDFSGAFKQVLGHVRLPPAAYIPELMAPEGLSTNAGEQAMQRIRIVPSVDGGNFPTLVIGSCNVSKGWAEIRSYDHLAAQHRQRFGRPLLLDRNAYDQFTQQMSNYFTVAQLKVKFTEPSPEELADLPKPSRVPMIAGAVVVLGLAAALAYLLVK